jgi:hypothetical protein
MAFGISSNIKAQLRPKLGKRNRSSRSGVFGIAATEHKGKRTREAEPVEALQTPPNAQLESQFFQRLPVEIRKIVYSYVWEASCQKCHIYMKYGRLANHRCVMGPKHGDFDFIQKEMDRIHEMDDTIGNLKDEIMRTWNRRLMSTWGTRHWDCEQNVEYSNGGSSDMANYTVDFMSVMLVCKLM